VNAALAHARARALRDRAHHRERIARLIDPGIAVRAVRGAAVVTLNFHPDRLLADGRTVAEGLLEDGAYRNQFETGISNGALGGPRPGWEAAMFAGAYAAAPQEGPKYGGLNLMRHFNGACAGFGSCHLRLRPAALERTTFIFGDSVAEPADIAVIDALEPVVAPLVERIAATGIALGRTCTLEQFVRGEIAPAMNHDLYDYIEAHVHGPLVLTDVEALVIDPAFAGTPTGDALAAAAKRYGFALEAHAGCALAVESIPDEFPGEYVWQEFCSGGRARAIAERIAPDGVLDATKIPAVEDLQARKYLWRMLVETVGSTP
jgi:hypothetical protein